MTYMELLQIIDVIVAPLVAAQWYVIWQALNRIDTLKENVNAHQVAVAETYVAQTHLNTVEAKVLDELHRIHARLDKLLTLSTKHAGD